MCIRDRYADGEGNVTAFDNHRIVRAREETPSPKSILITGKEATRLNRIRKTRREEIGEDIDRFEAMAHWRSINDYKKNEIIELKRPPISDEDLTNKRERLSENDMYSGGVLKEHSMYENVTKILDTALEKNRPVYTFNDKQERKEIKDKLASYSKKVRADGKEAQELSLIHI